jgi:hypothetical protein
MGMNEWLQRILAWERLEMIRNKRLIVKWGEILAYLHVAESPLIAGGFQPRG